ncbi:putative RNA-directed DNA polymerase from transposon X-element [Trichonephila clavipes]|nr:putative RNA-directed DNA polymerase from transposon X-element [Trichonephila clavipes]
MYDFGLMEKLPIFIFNFLAVRYIHVRIARFCSARASVLKRLDAVYHSVMRICSGAFRNSLVTSLHVVCHQPPVELRRRQLRAKYFIRAMSVHVRFHVRIRHSSSHRFLQDQGNIQIPIVSEVRFHGIIFDCKLTFLPHVLYLRKKSERSLNILKVLPKTLWGADRVSLLRVYQALILSRLEYGCVVYGSARASVLKRLDTIHHSALRICSGAFRTSPVTSLYVVCPQPPLELKRRQLCANYFISAMSSFSSIKNL